MYNLVRVCSSFAINYGYERRTVPTVIYRRRSFMHHCLRTLGPRPDRGEIGFRSDNPEFKCMTLRRNPAVGEPRETEEFPLIGVD